MKRVLFSNTIIISFFGLVGSPLSAQMISTNASSNVDQMVRLSLDNDCVQISNVSSNANGSVNGLDSFGSFNAASSAFPFDNGFFLTTGNASSAGNNPIVSDLNDGTTSWTGDVDLEHALGIANTLNATVIEFDLVSVTDVISFNYLLASEEYQLDFPCNVGDGFALLIKPTGSTLPYENMAIIPGTNTPVGINTVHPEIVGQCAADNPTFFAGIQLGDTNYAGRTVPFTATASVIPNQSYHLKMVVADQFDFRYDTAVFIESGSLNAVVDLGPDLTVCTSATLDAAVGNQLATYQWFTNGVLMPGENSSTLFIDATATYTVEVSILNSSTNCIITDDILVTIDPDQLNLNVSDFVLCDDSSNDGIENFNLTAQGNATISSLSPGNYNFAYYDNPTDAQNETNALAGIFTNTSNPQTVYIRIEDLDSGCNGISSMDLIINPIPDATDWSMTVCASNANGTTPIDLTTIDAQVTSSTGNVITYHSNMSAAVSNSGALTSPYTNTGNPDTIIARISNPVTGCYSTSNVLLDVTPLPVLSSTSEFIDACDDDRDGFATFDLTAIENEFTNGLSNFSAFYHLSQQDAIDCINAINTPTAFNNTTARIQDVFIRIQDNTTGCSSIARIRLYTNRLLDATNIKGFGTCDDPSNDGFAHFLLDQLELIIVNGLEMVTVEFYETLIDQQADTNRLDKTIPYLNTSNPQTMWIRVISPTCVEFAEIILTVEPYFDLATILNQTYCDEDQDLITTIPLNGFDDAARGNLPAGYPVRYFLTQQDAFDAVNPITSITNSTNPVTVYVEVTNINSCANVKSMEITILPAPLATIPSPFIACDTDQDGFFTIDLTSKENEITTAANHSFSYHNTALDAASGSNAIAGASAFNAQTSTIYTRVVDGNNGCPTIVEQEIIINTNPVFPLITSFDICEADGDQRASFVFNTKDNQILNGQTGKVVSYHLTAGDAASNSNPIDKNTGYINSTSPQTIYVRVENISDSSCYGTDSFTIEVNAIPVFNSPDDLSVCDSNNDGISTFDLQPALDQISNGISGNITVNFFENITDANTQTNALPMIYTNTVNPQFIVARIGNNTGCYVIENIKLNVIDPPLVAVASPSVACDDDYDGMTSFDLSLRQSDIVGARPFNSIISWHTSLVDAQQGIHPIPDATNFSNTSITQTVYLRTFNTVSGCSNVGSLDLIVELPPVFNAVASYLFCEHPAMEIDLNEVSSSFIDLSSGDEMVTYYSNELNAIDGVNALPTPYTYGSNSARIYVRIENIITSCYVTTDFDLQIQASPLLPVIGSYDLEFCDDDNDGFLSVNVLLNEAAALGALNTLNHTVQFYPSFGDAQDQMNEITGSITAWNGTEIFTLVTETTLGCTSIGSFIITVNPLPYPPTESHYVLCDIFVTVDAATGASDETYLWSTGETTSSIDITAPGNYNVIITNALGCASPTAQFSVTQSSSPEIDFITKVDFGNPNSITVEVNGTGDYLYVLNNGAAQRSNIFLDVRRGYHDIVVIDINGCDPTPPQRVLIIDYPRFFTPNGDNFNDVWQIDYIETFGTACVSIFDRFGKLIKTLNKNSNGWDGTYTDRPMPSSDYWFLVEIKDDRGDYDIKGHFSLKR